MSLIQGLRRNCRIFWCYQCQRTVRVISSSPLDVLCPRCYGQFLHEIDLPRPRLFADHTGFHPLPAHHDHHHPFFPVFGPSTWRRDTELDRFLGLEALSGTGREQSSPWIVFRRTGSDATGAGHHPAEPIVPVPPEPEPSVPPTVHPGDYFAGPSLNELIGELTQNDRPGLPAAPASAIDAMPTVYITGAHLTDGSQCPVCKEEFGLGEAAREMPCKHVYHSECIVPWLRIHNSCPVCRFQLPTNSVDDEQPQDDGEELSSSSGDMGRGVAGWNPFFVLWPFRTSSRRWDYHYGHREPDPLDSPSAFYAWWRNWFLL